MSDFGILHTVYERENGSIYNEIIENEFTEEYLVVEYMAGNSWIYTDSYFTNDLDDERSDQSIIFSVEELAQIPNLKSIVAGDL